MTAAALAPAPGARRPLHIPALATELLRRQKALAWLGFAMLAIMAPALVAWLADGRSLGEVSVWSKPLKFMASVALFSLTMAWHFGYLPETRRRSRVARGIVWTIVVASLFEIAYITWQGGHGEASHFNESTAFHFAMYALMGLGATMMTATAALLGIEIARHGDPSLAAGFRLSLTLGLVMTFALGAPTGAVMSALASHGVGGVPGGAMLPIFGWSTTGGDLRVAHFLGIHAQQIVPAFGWLMARMAPRAGRAAVAAFALLYIGLVGVTLAQALAGLPILRI